MLRKNEITVIHPVFGKIRIEEKFAKVLELQDFRELAFKSQLGTKSLSKNILNAKHTRLMHSIGVMYLTTKLLEICEKKFSKYFEITQTDKESLQLAALGHDLGHLAFSHSLENRNMKTHEQRTIEYFQDCSEAINKIFGYDIVSNVIKIYQDNIDAKKQRNEFKAKDKLDILFIFKSLLVGAIDCDRMEYIVTDRYNVFGEKKDYQDIFNYITIVLLNDSPTVGFEKDAVPLIEDMLITRFNQYASIYYDEDSILTEIAIQEYARLCWWEEEDIVLMTEYDILSELRGILQDADEKGTKKYRLAQIIFGKRENIMFKKFDNKKEYEYFLKRLKKCTKREDIIKTKTKKFTVYKPDKYKVYIKDEDGVVKDLMEVSTTIKDISIDYGYVMVDLDPVYRISEAEVEAIKSLFLDNPVEIEKKFTFNNQNSETAEECCKRIENILKQLPGIEIEEMSKWEKVVNNDLYFEPITQLPKGVALRHRTTGEEDYYYVKTPADDGTTITKRNEIKYHCNNLNEFLELIKELFNSKGYNFEKIEVKEGVKITTNRYKTLANVQGSIVEIACDFSTYQYNSQIKFGMMLECEYKGNGDDISLWYLSKQLRQNGFIETNESKETRAKKAFGIN